MLMFSVCAGAPLVMLVSGRSNALHAATYVVMYTRSCHILNLSELVTDSIEMKGLEYTH